MLLDSQYFEDKYFPATPAYEPISLQEAREKIEQIGGDELNLWSVVEGECGAIFIDQGCSQINCLGYIVTYKPYDKDGQTTYVWAENGLVVINSSQGQLTADWGTGEVITVERFDDVDEGDELPDIVAFDMDEWREAYGVDMDGNPGNIDILDLGYTAIVDGEESYEPPASDWRELKARDFDL